jgi:tRNA dimethylallyltransferase
MQSSQEIEPQELCKKNPLKAKKKRCLILAGPTAVGKTALSLDIAKKVSGEIISFDSMQVYRGMDIGTAKVTQAERMQVAHHMIDVCDVTEKMNVVKFYVEAKRIFNEIIARGNCPILVGGTGFYIHTFLYGPPKGPESNAELRERLEKECDHYGVELLYDKVVKLDPDYAASITKADRHKIIRALEIMELSNKRVSQIPKPSQEDLAKDVDFRCWFMHYPKNLLYPRILERCDRMLEMGLLEEVQSLLEKGLEKNSSARNSIGYKQVVDFLQSNRSHEDYEVMIEEFKRVSKKLAKRQFTWFRQKELFEPLDMTRFSLQQAAEFIIDDLHHC